MASLPPYSRRHAYPACDLCYARKVKCDRTEPCGNCVDSNAKCLRTRPNRRGRFPQASGSGGEGKMESVLNRLSEVESSLTRLAALLPNGEIARDDEADTSPMQQHDGAAAGQAGSSPASDNTVAGNEQTGRPHKRARVSGHGTSVSANKSKTEVSILQETDNHRTFPSTSDHNLAATDFEAQGFIQDALADKSQCISVDRRSVLEDALDFIGQMEDPTKRTYVEEREDPMDMAECIIPPAPEFLQLSLSEPYRTYPGVFDLEFSTHTSRETLERMALALYNKSKNGQILLQFSICVNAHASTFLWNSYQAGKRGVLQEPLEKSRKDYLRRYLSALNHINILEKPSLSLLQALLTGTFLAQRLGDTPKSWMLVSSACRVCVALGLHQSRLLRLPYDQLSDRQKEMSACFLWCYVFDKGLAMNLGRPVCMPIRNVSEDVIAPIVPDRPFTAFIHILFKFARVQATIVCDLYYQSTEPPQRIEAIISTLKQQMENIRKKVVEIRASPPHCSDAELNSEWVSLDFVYHSIMTVILRFDTSIALDAIKREECLDHARKAFIAFRDLKSYFGNSSKRENLAPFLPWTVLYYPLRPYFVLFCNVVATSHVSDFELMKEFAETLTDLPNPTSSAKRLQRLCAALVGICKPLVNQAAERQTYTATRSESAKTRTSNRTDFSEPQVHDSALSDSVISENNLAIPPSITAGPWFQQSMLDGAATVAPSRFSATHNANGAGPNSGMVTFDALFDVQPSLDWLGSDVFNEGAGWWEVDGGLNMS